MLDSENYQVKVSCMNCRYAGSITFPKGTRAEKKRCIGPNRIEKSCPVCDCYTLVKCW